MRLAFSLLISTVLALLLSATTVNAAPQHALTVYGEPAKYPAGFSHFASFGESASTKKVSIPRATVGMPSMANNHLQPS